jgi:hypothetical protein
MGVAGGKEGVGEQGGSKMKEMRLRGRRGGRRRGLWEEVSTVLWMEGRVGSIWCGDGSSRRGEQLVAANEWWKGMWARFLPNP